MEPKDFIRKIGALGIDELSKTKIKNQKDAKTTLKKLRMMQKRVKQIKKELILEIKKIRAVYRQKSETAGVRLAAFNRLLGNKGAARSARASARRRVVRERDRVITEYENLKLKIDNMIIEMDRLKMQLEEYIQKERTKASEISE
jgi:hypothetical protein